VTPGDTATPAELWTAEGRRLGNVQLDLPADRERFREEIAKHPTASDSVYTSRAGIANGHTSYYVAVPVHDEAKRVLGYVVQERRIGSNSRVLQPLSQLIGADIDVSVRNRDDNLWVRFDGSRVPPPSSEQPALDSLALLEHGEKGQTLAASQPIDNTRLMITTERQVSHILARPLAAIRVLMVISIFLAVAGAMLAWLLSRRLVQPLKDLTSAAESIAQGDYERRVNVGARDEVGRLGSAFNRMAEEVQDSSDASANALARLTRAMETQEFLAEASRILAGSLSDDVILANLARYCVPRFGDYCTIHIADDDGSIRRAETAHRDPSRLTIVRELVRHFAYRLDGPGEVAEVIRTQQPLLIASLDSDVIRSRTGDHEIKRLLDEVHPRSFMCVPLVARGSAFGAMSFTITDGERRFDDEDVEIAMELARRASGAIDNAVIYQRSVALRMEAEAASNAKSDFLAKMSHEIRTPINAMMGYAELIQMGISGPVNDQQAKQLGRIRASGDHLTALVNEILDLAKIEAGQMGVQSTVAMAGDTAEAALTLIRPQANRKGVELASFTNGDGRMEYFGDPQRVQQILTNLLSNAIKFTASGGRVSVACARTARSDVASDRDWTCIRVEDTGLGIQPEDVDRIFQPFVQVESGYTRSQGGTGLGLTISRSLAQLMGGDITVESQPGVGSAFMLWLPCPNRAQVNA
jgi:signal transduction histidine kinase